MFFLGIRLAFHVLLLLLGLANCANETTQKQKHVDSNLLDLEISHSLYFLFANFDAIDKQITIENATESTASMLNEHPKLSKVHSSTLTPHSTTKLLHTEVKTTTLKPSNCGAKVTALTNIIYNSPTVHIQYWLLKPKLQLLRTFTGTKADEFGDYQEVVMRKGQYMVISYDFASAKAVDCAKLVEFSKKIVSYGKGDVPKIIVKCDCERTYYFKLA